MWLKSSHNVPRVVVKRLVESHRQNPLDGRRHENEAWLLSGVQNGGSEVEFWTSLETNFVRKTYTFEAETSAQSNSKPHGEVSISVETENLRFLD